MQALEKTLQCVHSELKEMKFHCGKFSDCCKFVVKEIPLQLLSAYWLVQRSGYNTRRDLLLCVLLP